MEASFATTLNSHWHMCSVWGLLIFCAVNKSVLLQTHKCRNFLMSICIYQCESIQIRLWPFPSLTFSDYSQNDCNYQSKLCLLNRVLLNYRIFWNCLNLFFNLYGKEFCFNRSCGLYSSDWRNALQGKKLSIGYIKKK